MKLDQVELHNFFNNLSDDLKLAIYEVVCELAEAQEKHPQWPTDFVDQAAIVSEESGELIRAALQTKYENIATIQIHKEAVQTAAMAIRLIINFEKSRSIALISKESQDGIMTRFSNIEKLANQILNNLQNEKDASQTTTFTQS